MRISDWSSDVCSSDLTATPSTPPDLKPSPSRGGLGGDGLPPGNDATPWTSATGQKIAAEAAPTGINEAGSAGDGTSAELAEETRLAAALTGSGRWLTLLSFFLGGLGLACTPCGLPMIPTLPGRLCCVGCGTGLRPGREARRV